MSKIILLTTPIGNIGDLSTRGKNLLVDKAFFAVEDTRSFKDLCRKLGLSLEGKRITSFHDHTDESKLEVLIEQVIAGSELVVASEAGSPAISDPAYPLIKLALEKGVEITSAPGASSVITALELSGLPAIPFHFHGFLSRDAGKRESIFEQHAQIYGTHIYFEGVSRALNTIDQLASMFPEFDIVIARELTKEFESIYRFKGKEWKGLKSEIMLKGEFVLLWHNPNQTSSVGGKVVDMAQELLENGPHPKKLSKLLSALTGIAPKECYEQLQKTKK